MSELPKSYDACEVEKKLYSFWEEGGFFQADPQAERTPFSIVMPPPNVTGVLHMGHALVNTLQDVIVRWRRMLGYEVLWVPGTDHAGIATQTVVERRLQKDEDIRRQELGREKFLERVWSWKEKSHQTIVEQVKSLGCSCDWSRERFTMDEQSNQAVRTMFKKLFDAGLIYRGDYLVNWDPVTQTALADDEVEYEEREGKLWHFRYPFTDGSGYAIIATTRPETMLGDTAVAVAPGDARYQAQVGKNITLPLMEREIPVITDHHVDPEFGSGMVKITPAHDPNDNQIGMRHDLPFINIMTPDGRINENGGEYQGLTMAEARKAVVDSMDKLGLLEKVEPHTHRVGISYRSKATIEPYMSKQWFVSMKEFAGKLRAALIERRTHLIPAHWEKTYFHWIDNLRDWCISRQLWWGHRIPIWYQIDNPDKVICYSGEGAPPEVEAAPEMWEQDPDVLDTWFSSALWPFSTLGWPEKTEELNKFYPNSLLITGHDILFFWVARMLFMGEYAMNDLPFPEVYLHGLIYGKSYWREQKDGGIAYVSDEERVSYDLGASLPPDVHFKWEKMSKSKGNIIDPLEIIDQYGTDAMRMALCSSATSSREIDLDRRRFEEFKNFANKVWNGARFVMMNLDGSDEEHTPPLSKEEFASGLRTELLTLEDRWILSLLNHTTQEVNEHLEKFAFEQAAQSAYDFFWKRFCAFYVEITKPVLTGRSGTSAERTNKQKLLAIVLGQSLRLLHPMAPYITEELFLNLKKRLEGVQLSTPTPHRLDPYTLDCLQSLDCKACMIAPYPQPLNTDDIAPDIELAFDTVERAIYAIRNIRGEMKIPPSTPVEVHLYSPEESSELTQLRDNKRIIQALVRTIDVHYHTGEEPDIGFAATAMTDSVKILIPIPAEFIEKERSRLAKEQARLQKSVEKSRNQLGNSNFVEKAPQDLIEKHQANLRQNERQLEEISAKLEALSE